MSNKINTRFSFDEQSQDNAKIKVIGVGGGGGNAINNMIAMGLNNVEYIALNTDAQALRQNGADLPIQVGKNLTNGLGAGARPEIGREAVEENRHDIEESIEGADMIFVTAGMGGGTGTGGAPVVSAIAKRKGILTVGVVTLPFDCEGPIRMKYAIQGVDELKKSCDTVIVIPNERLLDICAEDTTLTQAFEMANEVLYNATRGISDLILMPGLINLDFADVRTTMLDGGAAIMGSATATGPDRAEVAAREAINSPLLDGISIRGARNVLVNISAGSNLGMRETTVATKIVSEEAGADAEVILGTVLDENYGDELRITVIATGFEHVNEKANVRIQAKNPADRQQRPAAEEVGNLAEEKPETKVNPIGTAPSRPGDAYYKGESNLKSLDKPALDRRGGVRSTKEEEQEEEQRQAANSGFGLKRRAGNTLLNNNQERIDKRNSEQPAFLRKIMD